MSDNATLVERLKNMAGQAQASIPTDYYIHEKVDATFTEVAKTGEEAAARITELEAHAMIEFVDGLIRRIASLEANLAGDLIKRSHELEVIKTKLEDERDRLAKNPSTS